MELFIWKIEDPFSQQLTNSWIEDIDIMTTHGPTDIHMTIQIRYIVALHKTPYML